MNLHPVYAPPSTLQTGDTYYLRQRSGQAPRYRQVYFVAYTACPAVVIVADPPGNHFPCHRFDLFERPAVPPAG